MIKEAIVKIVSKEDLTYDEAYAVMNEIMSGETTATQNAAYMAKAQYWHDKLSGGNPSTPSTPSQPQQHATNLEALADAVIRGDYGNGDERKQRLGSQYDAVIARLKQAELQAGNYRTMS